MFENSKIFYLALLKNNGKYFKNIPTKFKYDRDLIIEANKTYPKSILYVSEKNKELILKLIINNINSYNYISESLKNNEEILLEAIKISSNFLSQEFNRLNNCDKVFILKIIKLDGKNYNYIPYKYKSDIQIIFETIKTYPQISQTIFTTFNNNQKIVLEFIKKNWKKYLYQIDNSLKYNKEFLLKLIKINGRHYKFIPEIFKDDEELLIEAIKTFPYCLIYTSKKNKNNKDIILQIYKYSHFVQTNILQYVSDELKNNKDFVLEVIKNNINDFKYISKELKNDKDFILKILKKNGLLLRFVHELQNDKECVLESVKNNSSALQYASRKLRNDIDFISEVIKIDKKTLQYASQKIRNIMHYSH